MIKKHNWIQYGRSGEIVEITLRDSTGAKADFFRVNNKKDYAKIIKIIKDKYGWSPEIEVDKSVNFNKEKDWLESDSKF